MPKVLCTKELASFVPKFDGVVLWNSLGSDRLIPWIEPEPVVDADGVQGLKVADVFPGSAAEKAGLHAGDVIHSINGYLTAKRDDLAWIMAKRGARRRRQDERAHCQRRQSSYDHCP